MDSGGSSTGSASQDRPSYHDNGRGSFAEDYTLYIVAPN